jgi:hypothetical protein
MKRDGELDRAEPGSEVPAARADALNQELAQLIRQRGELLLGELAQIRRHVDGLEQGVGVGWRDHLGQFILTRPFTGNHRERFVAQSPLGCGNAGQAAIVAWVSIGGSGQPP